MIKLPPRLVVFDTNIVEGTYLPFLLRGDPIRDLIRLRTEAPCYTPAICVKTLYEILGHLKSGGKKWSWLDDPELGYPGGLEEGERILSRSSTFVGRANAMYYFNHIEEFSFRCWSDHLQFAKSLVVESGHSTLEKDYSALEEFARWKDSLTRFLDHVASRIEREFFVLERHYIYGVSPEAITSAMWLERDLARDSLVPSEDFEILVSALAVDAKALVTNDSKLLTSGLSMSSNYHTALVSHNQLETAIKSRFEFRIYR